MKVRMMVAAISGMLVLALAGCAAPEPVEPTPTPAFASDEEAFAAAEATYRAYVDALNSRHADPSATPAPADFLIGDALEAELDTERILREAQRSVVGTAAMTHFTGTHASADGTEVSGVVCLDFSDSHLVDSTGTDVTPSDRPPVVALAVEFVLTGAGLAVSGSEIADDQTC